MWHFPPAPKHAPGSIRVVPPEETLLRVRPLLRRVPVTRIADLSPLDPIGLPVFAAVTPLALDLTTHLGKGPTPAAARASAAMEAFERVSAERVSQARIRRASFGELSRAGSIPPVDPVLFDLPPDSLYDPERPFDWLQGFDLLARESVLVPADLALNPPREGVLRDVDTNGLASGNILLEAVVHGICEVIERDALSELEFRALFADPEDPRPELRTIDVPTLPGEAREWVERSRRGGTDVVVQDVTNDLGVPTFRAFVLDPEYPTPSGPSRARFPGFGTHPDAAVAALRAVTEAVQSRLAAIQGARDSYNTWAAGSRAATRFDRARELSTGRRVSFGEIRSFPSNDLAADLEVLLEKLRAVGVRRVVAVDLTRPEFGIPAVRVRIAGLSSFIVNRRRVGWRCLRHLL